MGVLVGEEVTFGARLICTDMSDVRPWLECMFTYITVRNVATSADTPARIVTTVPNREPVPPFSLCWPIMAARAIQYCQAAFGTTRQLSCLGLVEARHLDFKRPEAVVEFEIPRQTDNPKFGRLRRSWHPVSGIPTSLGHAFARASDIWCTLQVA